MLPSLRRSAINSEDKAYSSSPDWASSSLINTPFLKSTEKERMNASSEDDLVISVEDNNSKEEMDNFSDDFGGSERGLIHSGTALAEDFTAAFWKPLQEVNEEDRKEALDSIVQILTESLHSESKALIKAQLYRLKRYAYQVPFTDITTALQNLIKLIKEEGTLPIDTKLPNPSSFIPSKYFPPVYATEDEATRQIYIDVFLQSGRVSNLIRLLALHSSFFVKYYAAFNFIMRDDGPLPPSWRNYIAILTASRSKCQWLVARQEEEFLLNGGNPKWLGGYTNAPKKLVNLMDIIVILCHQPWILTKHHVATLVKGSDSWSMGELVHAMLVICTFNCLAGVIFGCGVNYEVDLESGMANADEPEEEEIKEGCVMEDTNKVAELLKSGWNNSEPEEQQVQLFVKAETTESAPSISLSSSKSSKNCGCYLGDFNLQHVDFDVHSKSYQIFKVQDYCWKEDGFELVRRFLPGGGLLLDEEFDHIYTMTYNMFNQSANVDTLPFRRAIWQYVQRVKGMFHDDYNYQEVNMFLNRSTKAYVKKIVCNPETITKSDYNNVGLALRPDEKVHVALLAVESAKQSSLLYGLHAVMQHITSL